MRFSRVIAHRGSSASHADNSWAAFEAAVQDGADAIECDVVTTRDGALMIRHDLSLGSRFTCELSARELEAAEPGVVRLDDLLPWAADARIGLLIEIKEPEAALAAAAAVAAAGARDEITIGGYHGPALAAIKTLAPAMRTSFMMGSVVGADDLVHLAKRYRADGVHLCWEARATYPHRLLDGVLFGRLRDAGLEITLWHEERQDELQALVALEPDAICTNTPATLRRIVDAYREKHPQLNT